MAVLGQGHETMNRQRKIAALVDLRNMHLRYSQGCKRAKWHEKAARDCQQQINALVAAERSERRTVQGRLDGLYQ